ncbi:MAG: histidine kinase [Gemmatimonadota bacterium]
MSASASPIAPAWTARFLVPGALLLMATSYLLVFIADGSRLGMPVIRDAIANTTAAGVAAVPVWQLCRLAPWRFAARWWFIPLHLVGIVVFAVAWYLTIATALGSAGWLSGGAFQLQYLRGPALHWQAMTSLVLYFAVAASCYTAQAIREVRQSALLLRQAEVSALRAQLDPHLLFNTLHSLLELVRSGDARADDAIDRFARVARYVTEGRDDGRGMASLAAEWQMAQDYVALESLRLGERLGCDFTLDESLAGVLMPALTLQPLVENAIRHGVAPRPGPGRIEVSARRDDDVVTLRVRDDGLGATAVTRGSGAGLALVRRRLQACFGDRLQFSAGPRTDVGGWCVEARFPVTSAS